MKNFDQWNTLKKCLDAENTIPFFKEREVWWGSIGINIGHEENGKNEKFNRPILILKKFNNRLFWGIPLTKQLKKNKHYFEFVFKDENQCAMLTQIRLWDANRLTSRMGRIGSAEFLQIRDAIKEYLK